MEIMCWNTLAIDKQPSYSLDEIEKDELEYSEDYLFNNNSSRSANQYPNLNTKYNGNGRGKYNSPSRSQNVNANEAMMNHLWQGVKGKLQELEQEHYQGRSEVLAMRKAFGVE